MVYKQLILYLFLFTFTFLCPNCGKGISNSEEIDSSLKSYDHNGLKDSTYCFNEVALRLCQEDFSKTNKYFNVIKDSLNELPIKTNDSKLIKQFYEYTFFNEAYILKGKMERYLILIGKSRGATGIGVDYWNYQCYSLDNRNKVIEFASLSKTPRSVFFDKRNQLYFITVDDNYPRPADGVDLKLKYYPVIGSLYNEKKEIIKTIDYNCQN